MLTVVLPKDKHQITQQEKTSFTNSDTFHISNLPHLTWKLISRIVKERCICKLLLTKTEKRAPKITQSTKTDTDILEQMFSTDLETDAVRLSGSTF